MWSASTGVLAVRKRYGSSPPDTNQIRPRPLRLLAGELPRVAVDHRDRSLAVHVRRSVSTSAAQVAGHACTVPKCGMSGTFSATSCT